MVGRLVLVAKVDELFVAKVDKFVLFFDPPCTHTCICCLFAEEVVWREGKRKGASQIIAVGTPVLKEFDGNPYYGEVSSVTEYFHVVFDDGDGNKSTTSMPYIL